MACLDKQDERVVPLRTRLMRIGPIGAPVRVGRWLWDRFWPIIMVFSWLFTVAVILLWWIFKPDKKRWVNCLSYGLIMCSALIVGMITAATPHQASDVVFGILAWGALACFCKIVGKALDRGKGPAHLPQRKQSVG